MYDATKGVAIYDPLRFFGVNVRATCMECSFETLTNARCAVATIRYMAMVRSPYVSRSLHQKLHSSPKIAFRPTRTIHRRSSLPARYRQIIILGLDGIRNISSSISFPLAVRASRDCLSRSASAACAAAFGASSSSLRLHSSASDCAAAAATR
jgi:hypothetical protein